MGVSGDTAVHMRNIRFAARIVTAALIVVLARPPGALALPQQFSCVLTDTAEQLNSESRPIVVVFDNDAKTLSAQDGNRAYIFGNVSMSNIAISGDVDNVSLGIDRSSSGIVWQQYEPDKTAIEFGQCRRVDHPSATP